MIDAACGSTPGGIDTIAPAESTMAPPASMEATEQAAGFPIAAFAATSGDPMTEELAAKFQAALALHDVTGGGGMSAAVMTAEGTWSGTTGKADGVRDLRVDDQFAIASITKSVVAAQVMLMVEAGELGLDDPVSDHLPGDLDFDTAGATIRHLLGHRSGIPDYYDLLESSQQTELQRVWTPTEILELLPPERTPAGATFSYAETNYVLLSLVIEHLRGRPLADVLRERDGALAIDGLDRLVYQPDESPTEPMARPAGAPNAVLETQGRLPPIARQRDRVPRLGSDRFGLALAGAVVAGVVRRQDPSPRRHSLRCRRSSRWSTSAATDSACTTRPTGTPKASGTPDRCPAICRGPHACPRTER